MFLSKDIVTPLFEVVKDKYLYSSVWQIDCGGEKRKTACVVFTDRFPPNLFTRTPCNFSAPLAPGFWLASLQTSNGCELRVLTCFSARTFAISTEKYAHTNTLLICAVHFGSFGSAPCPTVSRRIPAVWNGQVQKFGQKTTSLNLPQWAMSSIANPPAAVNKTYMKGMIA